MGVCACLWEFMGIYGGLWGLWESMDECEYVGVFGYLWQSVGAYGSLCVYMGVSASVYGYPWIFMSVTMGI